MAELYLALLRGIVLGVVFSSWIQPTLFIFSEVVLIRWSELDLVVVGVLHVDPVSIGLLKVMAIPPALSARR